MNYDDITAFIEEIEKRQDQPKWYVCLYWQDVADEHGVVSLVQANWSSLSEPCSWERAFTAITEIRENKDDAVMLVAESQYEAEQLVVQTTRLGAKSVLDE